MIGQTLAFLTDELNAALARRFGTPGDLVLLGPVTAATGKPPQGTENRIILSLVNVEREPIARNTAQHTREIDGARIQAPPPLNINLLVMAAANFEGNYTDGLNVLSATLGHFQANPLYTAARNPALPKGLNRLSVEWKEANVETINNLWMVLGGRYLPSVLYLARMIVVDDALLGAEIPPITTIAVGGDPV